MKNVITQEKQTCETHVSVLRTRSRGTQDESQCHRGVTFKVAFILRQRENNMVSLKGHSPATSENTCKKTKHKQIEKTFSSTNNTCATFRKHIRKMRCNQTATQWKCFQRTLKSVAHVQTSSHTSIKLWSSQLSLRSPWSISRT